MRLRRLGSLASFRGTHGFLHTRRGFVGATQALDRRAREIIGVAFLFRSNSGFDRRRGWRGGWGWRGGLNGFGNRFFTQHRLMPAGLRTEGRGAGWIFGDRRGFPAWLSPDGR